MLFAPIGVIVGLFGMAGLVWKIEMKKTIRMVLSGGLSLLSIILLVSILSIDWKILFKYD